MNENLKFIVFSVNQAVEAEEFGFTRNQCCRNLKAVLHQYWQHRVLGMHGVSQKKNLPRSVEAIGKDTKECDVEHVVPMQYIVDLLMDMKPITNQKVKNVLKKYYYVMLITKEEHAKLNSSGLRSKMPENWDGKDVLARYKAVGINPA